MRCAVTIREMPVLTQLNPLPGATLLLGVCLLLGCPADQDSPQAQVRSLIERAQAAAEQKNTKLLREMVSADYADERGHDKRAVESLVRYYFLQHQSIHVFTRIEDIQLDASTDGVRATLFAAMAGQRIDSADALSGLRADLYRFELDFVKDPGGQWQVIRADWRGATIDDFL